ncbi:MAG: cyclic nucleotide-binding domain-containing protein [Clostridia bacterium]|nr:cyclic nucleotide-binding domain-containing protein [Clostridia bacterium]
MTGEDLSGIVLFRGMTADETKEALSALFAREKTYKKGELIMRAGSVTNNMGIVLSGSVSIESVDAWGGCTILSHVPERGFFAELRVIAHKADQTDRHERRVQHRLVNPDLRRVKRIVILRGGK